VPASVRNLSSARRSCSIVAPSSSTGTEKAVRNTCSATVLISTLSSSKIVEP
jgi:hypothetical protein